MRFFLITLFAFLTGFFQMQKNRYEAAAKKWRSAAYMVEAQFDSLYFTAMECHNIGLDYKNKYLATKAKLDSIQNAGNEGEK